MLKFILSIIAALILITSTTFAHEYNINAYMETSIGNFIDSDEYGEPLRDYLTTEIGLSYEQNFDGLEWLTAGILIYGDVVRGAAYSNLTGKIYGFKGELGLGINGGLFGVNTLDFALSVDTNVEINFETDFNIGVGFGEIDLWLGVDLCGYWTSGQEPFFQGVYLGAEYSIGFNDIFGLVVGFELSYDDDINIQTDLNFVAELESGFNAFAGLRFEANKMIDEKHDEHGLGLAFRAGINYALRGLF